MSNVIGAKDRDSHIVVWHASAAMPGNLNTLCATSLNDDQYEQVLSPKGQRITCRHCHTVWLEARRFKQSDFVAGAEQL